MAGDSKDSDAYATIIFPDGKKVNTETIDNTVNPLWKQLFTREIKMVKP
jgi:Ca2+-dependent lipid-binding protein